MFYGKYITKESHILSKILNPNKYRFPFTYCFCLFFQHVKHVVQCE